MALPPYVGTLTVATETFLLVIPTVTVFICLALRLHSEPEASSDLTLSPPAHTRGIRDVLTEVILLTFSGEVAFHLIVSLTKDCRNHNIQCEDKLLHF